MKKRITRLYKVLIAEVYEVKNIPNPSYKTNFETIIDKKLFNDFRGNVLNLEPRDKDYQEANKWADEVIAMHKRNTET